MSVSCARSRQVKASLSLMRRGVQESSHSCFCHTKQLSFNRMNNIGYHELPGANRDKGRSRRTGLAFSSRLEETSSFVARHAPCKRGRETFSATKSSATAQTALLTSPKVTEKSFGGHKRYSALTFLIETPISSASTARWSSSNFILERSKRRNFNFKFLS